VPPEGVPECVADLRHARKGVASGSSARFGGGRSD
jgi:hypothetical protein